MRYGLLVSMLVSVEDFMQDIVRDGNTDVCSVYCGTALLFNCSLYRQLYVKPPKTMKRPIQIYSLIRTWNNSCYRNVRIAGVQHEEEYIR
jgi:hypothetical protein